MDLFKKRNGVISKMNVAEATKRILATGEKIDNTWYLPFYVNGDFSSAYDFWRWWDKNNQEICRRILYGISPSIKRAWEIAKMDNIWIIAASEE